MAVAFQAILASFAVGYFHAFPPLETWALYVVTHRDVQWSSDTTRQRFIHGASTVFCGPLLLLRTLLRHCRFSGEFSPAHAPIFCMLFCTSSVLDTRIYGFHFHIWSKDGWSLSSSWIMRVRSGMIAPFTIFPSTAKEREEINHLIVHAVRSRSRQCSHSFASQSFHQSIIAFTVHMPGLLSCTQQRTSRTISSLKAWCKNIAGSFNVFFREYVFFC